MIMFTEAELKLKYAKDKCLLEAVMQNFIFSIHFVILCIVFVILSSCTPLIRTSKVHLNKGGEHNKNKDCLQKKKMCSF